FTFLLAFSILLIALFLFLFLLPPPPISTLFPYTTLFRSHMGVHVPRDVCAHTAQQHQLSWVRSEEHTSELQSRFDLVCRLLLENNNYLKAQTSSTSLA